MAGATTCAAAKAALHGIVAALSAEHAPAGVLTNAVLPGLTLTDRAQRLIPEAARDEVASRTPPADSPTCTTSPKPWRSSVPTPTGRSPASLSESTVGFDKSVRPAVPAGTARARCRLPGGSNVKAGTSWPPSAPASHRHRLAVKPTHMPMRGCFRTGTTARLTLAYRPPCGDWRLLLQGKSWRRWTATRLAVVPLGMPSMRSRT